MDVSDVLRDTYSRINGVVHHALDGIDSVGLTWRPEPDANPIGWLVWHLTRIQDDHVAEVAGRPQVWDTDDWATLFGLDVGATDTGQNHTSDQVAALRPRSPEVLTAYHDAVTERTDQALEALTAADLDRVIDTSYDPPVTVGIRLVSVISDNLQHARQARYLRGSYDRTLSRR